MDDLSHFLDLAYLPEMIAVVLIFVSPFAAWAFYCFLREKYRSKEK